MRFHTLLKCGMVAASLLAVQAKAAFIEGEMGYSTELDATQQWSANIDLDSVTIGHGEVDFGVGDLAPLPSELIAPVTFNYDASFEALTIWEAGEFSFELKSVTLIYESSDILLLTGAGLIHSSNSNYESTAAQWQFSGNIFTYSAGTIATPTIVPVPAGLWLFASALGGLFLSRFKK